MANLARFSTSVPRLSERLIRPSTGAPLRSRARGGAAAPAACLEFAAKNGFTRADLTVSSSAQENVPRRRKASERVTCWASLSDNSSPNNNAGIALLSPAEEGQRRREEAPIPATGGRDPSDAAIPLCERPGASPASLMELCRWRNQAQELATSVGSEFVDTDGGPEVSDLFRELEWLLDDTVAACALHSDKLSDANSSAWKACAWRDIKDFRIPKFQKHDKFLMSSGGAKTEEEHFSPSSSSSSGDVSAIYGAFGALCKDRHTDPVNEFAADCGFSCDGIREALSEMTSSGEISPESMDSVEALESALTKLREEDHDRPETSLLGSVGLQLLLRMSIGELDAAWKERIQKRRPFQYVVAAAHWRDFVLGVVEGVLIPRPETEQIVDLVESAVQRDESLGHGLWADLGTGSGAIAVALARLLPETGSVVAIDASSIAVQVARRNIEKYSLQSKVTVLQGFWFSPLSERAGELAGVISNPPYIPSDHLLGLQAEVGKHEPRIALDGGPDGMNDLRQISTGAATALRSGGFLALETNGGEQADALVDLISGMRVLERAGVPGQCFQDVRIVKDFAGVSRFVTATRC